MRTCCMAQGTLLNALWWPAQEGNRRGGENVYMDGWFTGWTGETNPTLRSNYIWVKINETKTETLWTVQVLSVGSRVVYVGTN